MQKPCRKVLQTHYHVQINSIRPCLAWGGKGKEIQPRAPTTSQILHWELTKNCAWLSGTTCWAFWRLSRHFSPLSSVYVSAYSSPGAAAGGFGAPQHSAWHTSVMERVKELGEHRELEHTGGSLYTVCFCFFIQLRWWKSFNDQDVHGLMAAREYLVNNGTDTS